MTPDELLDRLAATLRTEIGPAVGDEYPRTQAFMGAVVLERIARELRAAAGAEAERLERVALYDELDRAGVLPDAVAGARADGTNAGLCALIEAMYRDDNASLARVRAVLRAQIDRRVAIAR